MSEEQSQRNTDSTPNQNSGETRGENSSQPTTWRSERNEPMDLTGKSSNEPTMDLTGKNRPSQGTMDLTGKNNPRRNESVPSFTRSTGGNSQARPASGNQGRTDSELDLIGRRVSDQGRRHNVDDYSLEKIIEVKAEARLNYNYNRDTEEVITIHPRRGVSVEDNIWNRWTKTLKHYWVSYHNIAEVKGLSFSILDVDSGETLQLFVDYQVKIIQGQGQYAVELLNRGLSPVKVLNEEITQWIKTYCSEQYHLTQDFFQFEDQLKSHVQSKGQEHGLHIQAFIRPEIEDPVTDFYTLVDHEVACRIKNYELQVKVNLALNLVDQRLFRKANIDNVDTYVRQRIESIVQNELLSISYAQLVREFTPKGIQGKIKNAIDKFTAGIGFSVTQLVAIPQLDIFQWLDQFHFVTDEDENGVTLQDQEYATKDSRINVKLSIAVNGRVSGFHGDFMEKLLRPDIDLRLKMKEVVIEVCRNFLHETEPSDFYFHFGSKSSSGYSFESSLEGLIRAKLEKEYNAEDLSIIIKPVDTEITRRFKGLQRGAHQVRVTNFLGEVDIDIWYKVLAIHPDGWSRFQANDYDSTETEIAEISRKVKNYVEYYLNNILPVDFNDSRDTEFHKQLETIISGPKMFNGSPFGFNDWLDIGEKPKCAKSEVISEFGLVIQKTDIRINTNEFEKGLIADRLDERHIKELRSTQRKAQAKLLLEGETQDLETLQEKRKEALEAEDDELVEQLDEQIRAIGQSVLRNTQSSTSQKFLGSKKNPEKGKLKWDDQDNNETNQ